MNDISHGTLPERGRWHEIAAGSLPFLVLLYAALFGAFGVESPFFPSLLGARGLTPQEIGLVLAAGTLVRLSSGPLVGIAADRFGTRRVLALAALGAGTIILLYLWSAGFWPLLAISMLHSVAVTPLNPLADALALNASAREGAFPYGWVRGIGSAAFICGTLASGVLVARWGIDSILVAAALLFLLMIPPLPRIASSARAGTALAKGGIAVLVALPAFRRMLLVAGLVIGSHATSDTFAVIQWRLAGIGATTVGFLWSEAVASEIVVFVLLGPWLLRRVGPAACAALAASAGILRWAVLALTSDVAAIVATQALHGLTFSLMHLACMQVIAATVPEKLSATAQTLYGTLCLGLASAVLTFLSGQLYGMVGAQAFWLMSALCLVALPLTFGIRTANPTRRADVTTT